MLQKKAQILKWIKFIGFCRFYHRIDFHTGIDVYKRQMPDSPEKAQQLRTICKMFSTSETEKKLNVYHGVQAVILALLFYKLVMCATLDNSALLKHHNTIGVAYG